MINPLLHTKYLITETDPRRLHPSEAEVTFVGRSNVGKSSLLCSLCEDKKLARVSKLPGRTRGINVFEVRRGRWLVDLPGYGYAEAPKNQREYWPKMIGGYLTLRPQLALVYVLIDSELGVSPIDLSLLLWLREQKISCSIVGTKVDRLSQFKQMEKRAALASSLGQDPDAIYWVSAKKGYGMKELRRNVAEALRLV